MDGLYENVFIFSLITSRRNVCVVFNVAAERFKLCLINIFYIGMVNLF